MVTERTIEAADIVQPSDVPPELRIRLLRELWFLSDFSESCGSPSCRILDGFLLHLHLFQNLHCARCVDATCSLRHCCVMECTIEAADLVQPSDALPELRIRLLGKHCGRADCGTSQGSRAPCAAL